MKIQKLKGTLLFTSCWFILLYCSGKKNPKSYDSNDAPSNVLNFIGTPTSASDRSSLAFSDQGSWFAYGFSSDSSSHGGFAGPFLMTQENGVWSSKMLSQLKLTDSKAKQHIPWREFSSTQTSYNSHLEQEYKEIYSATYKLLYLTEGLLDKGPSIRENYQPITGAGLESENFSWSAAHYLLLLLNE